MGLMLSEQCFCGANQWTPAFSYSKPPQGETRFPLPAEHYKRSYYQCPQCGHLHGRHNIDLGFLYDGAYVDATYGDYDGIARTFDRIVNLPPDQSDNAGRVARITSFVQQSDLIKTTKPRLLDIGAGLGVFPHAMKQAGWSVTAVDPDARAASHMRDRLGISVLQTDIFDLDPGSAGLFDVITLNKVLEHVVDPASLLERCASFLDAGGLVYFEVPDGPGALSEGPEREEFFIEHHHAFSLESACHLAGAAGLETLSARTIKEPSSKYTIYAFAAVA